MSQEACVESRRIFVLLYDVFALFDEQRRIDELLNKRANKTIEKYAAEVEYTREVLLAELENARSVAEKAKNGSAMAMATLGKAKILGLIIDRREVGDVVLVHACAPSDLGGTPAGGNRV
jgi:hypothetical protein